MNICDIIITIQSTTNRKLSGSTHILSYPDYNQLCFTSIRPLRIPSDLDSIHKHSVQSRTIGNSYGYSETQPKDIIQRKE